MSTKYHLFIFTLYFYIVLDQWFLIGLCLNLCLLLNNCFLTSLIELYYVNGEGCVKEMVSCFKMRQYVGPCFPYCFSLKYF